MDHQNKTPLLALILLAFLWAGCGDFSTPQIGDLSLNLDTLVVGQPTTLIAVVQYTDLDADVSEAWIDLAGPGLSSAPMSVPITGSEGLTSAEVTIQLQIVAPSAGEYTLEVVIRDEAGHDSAPVQASLVAR